MDDPQIVYTGEFSIEERKTMTAEALKELRKAKKLSQKEVAAQLRIPATTYNTYESGRTEPPIEILVRLSHLYNMPIDLIVQRDRTYGNADDVAKLMAAFKTELAEYSQQLAEKGTDTPGMSDFILSLNKLADAMTAYSQTDAVQAAFNKQSKE